MLVKHFKFILILLLVSGCSGPYSGTNKIYRKQALADAKKLKAKPEEFANDTAKAPEYFVGTTNFSMRKPNFVILHHTAQTSTDQTLKTFTLPRTEVSAHYVIGRDGTVHHMLNDYLRAHHAGAGKWGTVTDMNSCSIGVELDNDGVEPFSDAQIASLLSLLAHLKQTYNIPTANFIGHADFAPVRKNDPSVLFPWEQLSKKGFGLWYDDVIGLVPPNFNHIMALRVIGYDTRDTTAAIRAFKRHFMQDTGKVLTYEDKLVLSNLTTKY
jgi:N-acetylmuramoyl-L-alanine amidase